MLAGLLVAGTLANGPVSPGLANAQVADSFIEYAENGASPLGTFVAYDQDGGVAEWFVSGPDRDLFTIDGGVLRFREPPDYEEPQSSLGGNVYRVTVRAGRGDRGVEVTVTDVDEAGTVSIDRPQPQVIRPLSATLSEEDDGVTIREWQWARSGDGVTWTDIQGATSQRRIPTPADEGMYLRVTVTYSDKFGSGKTASAVSANRVEPTALANAGPSFAALDNDEGTPYIEVLRSVSENSTVGSPVGPPVSATDSDEDVLFYELLDTPDLEDADGQARFSIDSLSGQIRMGKVLGADAREHLPNPDEREDEEWIELGGGPPLLTDEDAEDPGNNVYIIAGEPNNNLYVLRVRVSDPSTASDTVNVIVRVTDVNEPPQFDDYPPTLLIVRENAASPDIIVWYNNSPLDANTYAVTDQDAGDTNIEYLISGDDSEFFNFVVGVLRFNDNHQPDREEKRYYLITIEARSGLGARSLLTTLDVIVVVLDAEDLGEVTLSQREPQVGREVHARVTDPDGGVRDIRWVWQRSDEITVNADGNPLAVCRDSQATDNVGVIGGWQPIDGATSSAYTPTLGDVGKCLQATATYRDNMGVTDTPVRGVTEAPVQARRSANSAPQFLDQSGKTSRRVAENTEAGQGFGAPVTASDDDDNLLIYTLGGADAAFFGVTRNNGQLLTKAPLDYEARASYSVEVIATDPSGASTGIPVTINVANEDDPAQITGSPTPTFSENGTAPVETFVAIDQDRGAVSWSLSGPDEDLFTIDGGALRFKEPPDYEDPQSSLGGNLYMVTVEAGGGERDVDVTVTDVDEAGIVSIDRPQPQAERPLLASLSEDDAWFTTGGWQWARSQDGVIWANIEGATSHRRSPTRADVGMYLRATVTYSDKFGANKTASAVSAYRVEPRTLANAAPSFTKQDENQDTAYIDIYRSVPENTDVGGPVGEPVSATDADEDILFYELLDTPDLKEEDGNPRFTIDSLSGQIRMAKVLGADAEEQEDVNSADLPGDPMLPERENAGGSEVPEAQRNSKYVLRVKVSDPSTASATVNVIVTVTNVNEAPEFDEDAPTLLRVVENVDPLDDLSTYAATDQDADDTNISYSLSGMDRSYFTLGETTGALRFREGHRPSFELKRSYSITIEARSGQGPRRLSTTLDVTVEVEDANDPGQVTLSQRQPEVGIAIHATVSDQDGGVIISRWKWEQSDGPTCGNGNSWTRINGISSAVYTPRQTDIGKCLQATATYSDNIGDEWEAMAVSEVPVGSHRSTETPEPEGGFVNAAPVFPDQDPFTEGDQSDSTSRTVPENTEAGRSIGDPIRAFDDDNDLLIYKLSGTDAAFFRIARNDGRLMTRAPLDYEIKNTFTVVVTATDPFGAADSIVVTINVTDEDDPAVITIAE